MYQQMRLDTCFSVPDGQAFMSIDGGTVVGISQAMGMFQLNSSPVWVVTNIALQFFWLTKKSSSLRYSNGGYVCLTP